MYAIRPLLPKKKSFRLLGMRGTVLFFSEFIEIKIMCAFVCYLQIRNDLYSTPASLINPANKIETVYNLLLHQTCRLTFRLERTCRRNNSETFENIRVSVMQLCSPPILIAYLITFQKKVTGLVILPNANIIIPNTAGSSRTQQMMRKYMPNRVAVLNYEEDFRIWILLKK